MNILDEILEVKKDEIKILHRDFTLNRFRDSIFFDRTGLSLSFAMHKKDSVAIIGEIKQASPSKGILKEDFNHLKIADLYFENGIDAVSILTDKNFFKGDINYLRDISGIKTVPLLRKDFIVDEYQVYEAKSNGADAILLISEILSENQIKELSHCAIENRMEVLLELHSEEQIHKIDFSINKLIGINNRNLETFEIDLNTSLQIIKSLPKDIVIISESGISTRKDIDLIKEAGINGILVGGHFMTSSNLPDRIKEMKEWCSFEN